ncbi:MAG: hypothetical protein WEF50_09140 [Myxococcota bacterium]
MSTNLGLMFGFRNPPQWRRPFPELYASELRAIRDAEALGYDTIWLTEHHFAEDGYSPSVLPMHLPGMDPRHAHASMELFAREVAPRLR